MVSREAHDGYGKDIVLDRELDNQDDLDARGQLLWKPNSDLSVLLSADIGNDRNNGRELTSLGPGDDGDPRDSEQGFPQGFSRHFAGGSAHVDWSLEPGTLTSITAYQSSNTNDLYAYVAAPFALLPAGDYQEIDEVVEKDHTFTQELRFTSRSFGRFNFVSGLFYLHEYGTQQYSVADLKAPTERLTSTARQLSPTAMRSPEVMPPMWTGRFTSLTLSISRWGRVIPKTGRLTVKRNST